MGQRGEFDLIRELFSPLARKAPGALGLQDDSAILSHSAGHELVVTMDTILAGVHFMLTDPYDLIARKAIRVNLSDLAAMGARPIGLFLAISLPETVGDDELVAFANGIAQDCEEYNLPILGGDTTSGTETFTVTVTAVGEVETGMELLRSGAKVGDKIFVSGTIGDAAVGLKVLGGFVDGIDSAEKTYLRGRYQLAEPRLNLGRGLLGIASACIDISDGLIADFDHVCQASGIGGRINLMDVPLSAVVKRLLHSEEWWETVLTGGDDYELLFTAAPEKEKQVYETAKKVKVPVTAIGYIEDGAEAIILDANNTKLEFPYKGYQHR